MGGGLVAFVGLMVVVEILTGLGFSVGFGVGLMLGFAEVGLAVLGLVCIGLVTGLGVVVESLVVLIISVVVVIGLTAKSSTGLPSTTRNVCNFCGVVVASVVVLGAVVLGSSLEGLDVDAFCGTL